MDDTDAVLTPQVVVPPDPRCLSNGVQADFNAKSNIGRTSAKSSIYTKSITNLCRGGMEEING